MPVRIGSPQNVRGLIDIVANPIYATGVGLLQYGVKQQSRNRSSNPRQGNQENWLNRIKRWFQGGGYLK
jgi:cell division protein FtsA